MRTLAMQRRPGAATARRTSSVSGAGAAGRQRAGSRQGTNPMLSPTDHRQSSHHIHHPLSTHLPPDTRRKKGVPKKVKKKHARASVPGETPTIEEAEEDEDEACDTETERSAEELLQPGPPEAVQVRPGLGVGGSSEAFRGTAKVPEPMVPVARGHGSTAASSSHAPSQFFLQEDEVTEHQAEDSVAPPVLPGSPPNPHGSRSPKEAQAGR